MEMGIDRRKVIVSPAQLLAALGHPGDAQVVELHVHDSGTTASVALDGGETIHIVYERPREPTVDDRTPAPVPPARALLGELRAAVNRASAENGSNTPDFILAEFLVAALEAFDAATQARERWYGLPLRPGMPRLVVRDAEA